MNKPQTKTELYGRPQGNELVVGNEIIRRTGILKYSVIDRFISDKDASRVYQEWMKENNLTYNHRYTKRLNHAMLKPWRTIMTNELRDRIENFIVSWENTIDDETMGLADYDLFLEMAISLLEETIGENND